MSLVIAPELEVSKRLLTARARDLPLAEVMNALSKLYNLDWIKDGDGFRAVAGHRNRVEQRVEQIGRWYRYWTPKSMYFPKYLT